MRSLYPVISAPFYRRMLYRLMMAPLFITTGIGGAYLKAQVPAGSERVTLTGKQLPFSAVFRAIWEQTGKQAFYNDEQLSSAEKIDVHFQDVPLDKVLSSLLKNRNLTWYYREETFVIIPKKKGQEASDEEQNNAALTINGVVTDQDKAPLAGATVLVKGTRQGTQTGRAGTFALSVNKPATLIVTSMGYNPQEIPVRSESKAPLNIQLEPVVKGLDEVMVIAYGTAVRRNLTGSVSRITSADIEQQPVANALQAMQGRVTGLHVTQTSGLPGGDYKVELRGRNSINSGNNPFYIVDGVPFTATSLSWSLDRDVRMGANISSSPFNLINVTDIESIDVLKDADATAIYGSRGANGVVLITTKKGRKGKAQADINIYTGIGQVGHRVKYMNTAQYLQMRREAFRNDNETPQSTDYDMFWDSTRYTDWQKELIGGTSRITDAQTTVSGGTANAQYAVGIGYRRETTVYPGDFAYQKASASIRTSFATADRRGSAVLAANYVGDRNDLIASDLTIYSASLPHAPRPYNQSGGLSWANGAFDNPFANLLKRYKAQSNNLIASAVLGYKILDSLQLKTSLGYTRMQMDEVQVNPLFSQNPSYGISNGYSLFADGSISSWIIEPQVIYERRVSRGKLSILVGLTFQEDQRKQKGFVATGYTSDALLEDITAAADIKPQGVLNTQYRYNAMFGRINYAWREKYFLSLTGRRDGSSRFGPDSRFASFGAVGAAWVFTEEPWMRSIAQVLSFGKLRSSYGATGNDQIADYGYLDTYSPAPLYDGRRGLYPTRLFNAVYGWEKNVKLEGALELGFAHDRVLLTMNWYRNRSSNQLVNFTLPGVTGFSSIRSNLSALVENTGLEFELQSANIKRRSFTWNSSINLSIPRNRLLEFPGIAISSYNDQYTIGQPLNIFKGAKLEAVDRDKGIYVFKDMDGDGKISAPNDLTFTKQIGAVLFGGIQNNVQYKGWQLSVLFQFVKQHHYNYLYNIGAPGTVVNQPLLVLDRWQQPGDRTGIQQFTQSYGSPAGEASGIATNSDRIITDASYIRLKNVSLSWQLPDEWLRRLRLKQGQVYMQAQHLFTITPYPGIDPETAALTEVYPPLRICTAGLRFSF